MSEMKKKVSKILLEFYNNVHAILNLFLLSKSEKLQVHVNMHIFCLFYSLEELESDPKLNDRLYLHLLPGRPELKIFLSPTTLNMYLLRNFLSKKRKVRRCQTFLHGQVGLWTRSDKYRQAFSDKVKGFNVPPVVSTGAWHLDITSGTRRAHSM